MVKNDVSFILSFVILMGKMWIFGFSPGVCPTGPRNLVFSFECLLSNRRRALLGGIRLGASAIIVEKITKQIVSIICLPNWITWRKRQFRLI